MFEQIKNLVEKNLSAYMASLNRIYRLDSISPLLASMIRDYVLRPGKRVRPVLFAAAYLAYAKKEKPGIYTSCLSMELLHDFMLIHDDIIDRSDTRRGKPSMHRMLQDRFKGTPGVKFTGQDLSIVVGDILYAMAIHTFLTIQEEPVRKEKGLKRFIEAALFTGSGEFIELVYGTTPISAIRKQDIYKIYDYKTACYTFACPLSIGAILGGAPDEDIQRLFNYGIYLGRAFQIKDDILGIFGDEKEIGKSVLTDLQEAKKTLLMFYAFRRASPADRATMERVLSKKTVTRGDLEAMRTVLTRSKGLARASEEVRSCAQKAAALLESCSMRGEFKSALAGYAGQVLRV